MTRSPGSPSLELPGRRPPSQERRSFRVPVERVGTWQRCLRWKVPVQLVRSMSMCGGAANDYRDVCLSSTLVAVAVRICCTVSARAVFRARRIGPHCGHTGSVCSSSCRWPCSTVQRGVCGVRHVCQSPSSPGRARRSHGPTPSTPDVAMTPEAESRTDPHAPAEAAGQATAVEDRRAERPKPRTEEIDLNMNIKATRAVTTAAAKAVQAATAKQRNEVRKHPLMKQRVARSAAASSAVDSSTPP